LRPGRTPPASHLDHPAQRLSSLRLMNRATAEQKRIGWEMAVRIEKIHCTVIREAHKRQVEETMQTLHEGPEGFYGQGFPPAATSPHTAPSMTLGHSALWAIAASFEELRGKTEDALKCAVPKRKVLWFNVIAIPYKQSLE
jgi:thymidylate synthase ThyX